jgi:hypothetical protein
MIQEFQRVALLVDVPSVGLIAGDVGTVVDITTTGEGITVEFFNFSGNTVAVVPLQRSQVRPLQVDEVMHARPVKTA